MNELFRLYLHKFVLVFFDDRLIYSRNEEEYKEHVPCVLKTLTEKFLVIIGNKCNFGMSQVAYLGDVISATGVDVDQEKISAIGSNRSF